MTFTIPNQADASADAQASPDSRDFHDVLVPAFNQTGVVSGCAVTAQGSPDMTLAVASGTVLVGGTSAAVTAGNVTVTSADSLLPRFDLVCVSSAGTKSVVAGTANANPVFPDPAGKVVLASVFVAAAVTSITTTKITDKRVVIPAGPYGTAGGSLTGTYPNPTIGAAVVTDTMTAAANKDGAAATASMRTLGTGAQQALAGNTKLDQLQAPTDVTTLNVSASAHGLTPKLPNDATKFLDGTGAWTAQAAVTMDVQFTANPPAAAVAMNAKKITGLANGTSATDAAAFGQIPVLLAPTAVKTGAYNASAADLVLCNTTSASFTVTLPTTPADKTTIGIKVVIFGPGHSVTVAAGGSDVFNVASGATSQVFGNGVNQSAIWQYIASSAVWLEVASDPSTATDDLVLSARGLLAQTGDRGSYVGGDQAPVTQTVYARLLGLRGGMVVTGIALENSTAAVTTNPTTARAGLADATGKILVLSGNLNAAATWIGGVVQLPFTAPFTVPASGGFLACFVVNGVWGTPPTLARGRANNFAGAAMGAFAPDCVQWAGQTDLPAINSSLTLGAGGLSFWMGVY